MTHLDAIFIVGGAFFVVTVIGMLVAFDRSEARKEREWICSQTETMRSTVEWFQAEKESMRALELELRDKPWPQLRKLCEVETGRPCECATRYAVAQKIWWTRRRRELGS